MGWAEYPPWLAGSQAAGISQMDVMHAHMAGKADE